MGSIIVVKPQVRVVKVQTPGPQGLSGAGADLSGLAPLAGAAFTGPISFPHAIVGIGGLDLDGNGITGLFSLGFNTDAVLTIGASGVFGVYDSGFVSRLTINTEEQEIDLGYNTQVTGNLYITGTATTVDALNIGGLVTASLGGRLANFTFDNPFGANFAVAYHHSLASVLNYALLQDNLGNTRLNGISASIYVGNNSRALWDNTATYFFGNDGNLQATLFPGSRAILGNAYHFTLDVAGIVNAGDYLIGQDSATPQLELVGDSLTLGWLATHSYDFYMVLPAYNGIVFNKTNLGVNSSTLKDALRGAYSTINPLYANKSGMNVIACWLGSNDIVLDGDTPQQAFSTQQEFGRRQRSKGYKFVVATMISRNGADAAKNTFNALIRAHWAEFADGIADLAANANLGADGAYANATYFNADGIHLTDAGQALVGPIFQAALVEVITNSANKVFNGAVGFNNANALVKPNITGSRAGNAALANLLTQLANYGLITDSTT